MRYEIRMQQDYSYAAPSHAARNLIRVSPRPIPGRQLLTRCDVTVSPPPSERRDWLDFFGNQVTEIAFQMPINALSVTLLTEVDCTSPPPIAAADATPLADLPAQLHAVRDIGPDSPHHFLAASPRVRPQTDMTAYARACIDDGMTALQAALAIGQRLHQDMTFDAKATEVDTPTETAFAKRHGVCQDFSHVMIACLRGICIPAGYVSGYLRTLPPEGQPRLEGADAMHAWVRIWGGPQSGWMEYDPTNDLVVGSDHIVSAYGRDYSDVAPIRGVVRIAGDQKSSHRVDVIALD
ncbi:Protein-glutamine gamma-glutamyltransferase [Thalassovita gelatinovora]|uniref:Protein-glutamine gamma-glutamyltransferase n=1 Tax=Thalassovita gelatinovora TaxID=53501 RepID=A0A0P1FAN0_THAGE|nr:transglutaminase family protein [Thalassovita gelatinovora]QIZ80670.1 transglutaminase family protein [Thalassovita gelatinovora]CUH65235.1 Protein-glutamine gamma-glutamyltransferase [Thalassovita gelatinovora]SEQ88040.1 Transglutaminase-like enzyme, putative cysteine protease [Thalassovita gelatinovora]